MLVFPDGVGPSLLTCLIGGIPLNRVHEFEYNSGEVRLNINYDTAHEYLFSKPSQEYLRAIENGEEELKKLRIKSDNILNVREEQFLIKQQQLEEDMKRKKDEEENTKKKLKLDAMQNKTNTSKPITSGEPSQKIAVAGLTTLGVIGGSFLFKGDYEENQELDHNTENSSSELADRIKTPTLNAETFSGDDKDISLEQGLTNSRSSPSSVDKSNINFMNPKAAWDPDADDGGDAWLGALTEIMNDEEQVSTKNDADWQ